MKILTALFKVLKKKKKKLLNYKNLKKKFKKNLKKKLKKNSKKKLKKNIVYKKKKKRRNKRRKYRLKKKRKKLSIFNKMFALGKFSIYYNILFSYKPFYQQSFLKLKKKKRFKNLILKNNFSLNSNKIKSSLKKNDYKFILNLNLRMNNIFINLVRYKKRKTLKKSFTNIKFWSTGLFGLTCSKKRIKFTIVTFLKIIRKELNKLKLYLIKITGPKFYVKLTYKNLRRLSYKSKYIIVNSFKIFNGCRFRKMKRKKHLKFTIYR